MTRKNETLGVIKALKKVPETHLELFDVIREVVKPDGSIDYNKLESMRPRVNVATVQTEAYIRRNQSAVTALLSLPPRAEGAKRGVPSGI
jgi:hypothetical protein